MKLATISKQKRVGKVHIETKLTSDRIQDLIFSPSFTNYAQYRSIYTKKEALEQFVKKGGEVVLACLEDKTIIGFAVLDYPDRKERWARLGHKVMKELKAVEVSRGYRNYGIAYHLLSHLFAEAKLEQKILYLTAYSWTWDFDYLGLSIESYRNMLISLYSGFGFIEFPTNEPNICLKPENFFMAKVGKNVLHKVRKDFRWLRLGISC